MSSIVSALPAQRGHQYPLEMLDGEDGHSWPSAQRKRRWVWLFTYSVERQSPPLSRAIAWTRANTRAIVSPQRASNAQVGHQLPFWITGALACHSWPSAQRKRKWNRQLTYSSVRHNPPFSCAIAWTRANTWAFASALLASFVQIQHQFPRSIEYALDSHSCPLVQRQRRHVEESTYSVERQSPPFSRAIAWMWENVRALIPA